MSFMFVGWILVQVRSKDTEDVWSDSGHAEDQTVPRGELAENRPQRCGRRGRLAALNDLVLTGSEVGQDSTSECAYRTEYVLGPTDEGLAERTAERRILVMSWGAPLFEPKGFAKDKVMGIGFDSPHDVLSTDRVREEHCFSQQ
jgi:hypothetical protein